MKNTIITLLTILSISVFGIGCKPEKPLTYESLKTRCESVSRPEVCFYTIGELHPDLAEAEIWVLTYEKETQLLSVDEISVNKGWWDFIHAECYMTPDRTERTKEFCDVWAEMSPNDPLVEAAVSYAHILALKELEI